jgi:LuxR family transcriptional regulator, activator of conjugal transfer of Ti plasmids
MQPQIAAWLEAMAGVTTLPAFQDTLGRRIRELGFRYFVYHGSFQDGDRVDVDTTPAAWRGYRAGLGPDCEWELLCGRAVRATPVLWSRIRSVHPELFDKAREFGLATGITQPVHGPRGEWSSISFISDNDGPRYERRLLACLPYCQLLASLAHDAAARIAASPATAVETPRQAPAESELSERESACLGLAASGKTILQISAILPISARTVNYHLANARRKLHAASLRHAVTKAASLGLIRAA